MNTLFSKCLRLSKRLSIILILVVVSDCSSTKIKLYQPTALVKIENQLTLSKQWQKKIGNATKHYYFIPLITQDSNHIYVASQRKVYSLDKKDGKKGWVYKNANNITGATAQAGDKVFIGDEYGYVYALDKKNGALIWKSQVSSEVLTAPQSDSDIVVVVASDGSVHGLEYNDGSLRWQINSAKPVLLRGGISAPTINNGVVYIGQDNGKVMAINTTQGIRVWETRVSVPSGDNELERLVDIDARPLAYAGNVFAASFQGGLMAIEPQNGRSKWFQKNSITKDIGAFGGSLVIVNEDAIIKAFNLTEGLILWENEQFKYRKLNAPIVSEEYIFSTDYKGYLHILSRKSGAYLARKKVIDDGNRTPILHDEKQLFIYDKKGVVKSYKIID